MIDDGTCYRCPLMKYHEGPCEMTEAPEHAPTAEEQLPPLDEGLMDFPQKDNASDVLNQVAIRQCRERQLLAALRENRKVAELGRRDLEAVSNCDKLKVARDTRKHWQARAESAESKLRAVSDALQEASRRADVDEFSVRWTMIEPLFARIRAIVEGK